MLHTLKRRLPTSRGAVDREQKAGSMGRKEQNAKQESRDLVTEDRDNVLVLADEDQKVTPDTGRIATNERGMGADGG